MTTEYKSFAELVEAAPSPKEEPDTEFFYQKVLDFGKSALKGTAEGLGTLGRLMGPTEELIGKTKSTPEQLEEQTTSLDELIPTSGNFLGESARRGIKTAIPSISFPGAQVGGMAARSGMAGLLGEGAKELGLGPVGEIVGELSAFFGPNIFKKMAEKGEWGPIIKEARRLGLTDKEIAPLLNKDIVTKIFTKLAPRRGKTQEILTRSQEGLGRAYDFIKKSADGKKLLMNEGVFENLIQKLDKGITKLESGLEAKVRPDFEKLKNTPNSVEDVIDFFQKLNKKAGPNSKELSLLKSPIHQAFQQTNPQLAKDFKTINDLYGKWAQIQGRLQPNLYSDIMGAAKGVQLLVGITTGFYPLIAEVATQQAASKVAQKMLLNPRYKQLGMKMVDAAKQGAYPAFLKSYDQLTSLVTKSNPDFKDEIKDVNPEDIFKSLSTHQQEEQDP